MPFRWCQLAAVLAGAIGGGADLCHNAWVGDAPDVLSDQAARLMGRGLDLVVTHCRHDLGWLDQFTAGHPVHQTVVVSKCGKKVTGLHPRFNAKIIQAPNTGGNDQTWARYMAGGGWHPGPPSPAGVLVFLKDTHSFNTHQTNQEARALKPMLASAAVYGFGCGYRPTRGHSIWLNTSYLEQYDMTRYMGRHLSSGGIRPLGRWAASIGVSLPSPVTPVCYGGSFAVAAERIGPRQELMRQLASALAKSRTSTECHYVERIWASLFHDALTNETRARILRQRRRRALTGSPCPVVTKVGVPAKGQPARKTIPWHYDGTA